MIIYLIRHGQPLPREGKSDGEMLAVGLSRYGQLQAKAAGSGLKNAQIEYILASPVARARETAELIGEVLGVPVSTDERLREFIADPNEHDPVRMRELKLSAYEHPTEVPPSGESLLEATERLVAVIREVAKGKHQGVCIVSHRMIIEAAIAHLFQFNVGKHDWLHTASTTAFTISERGQYAAYFCESPCGIVFGANVSFSA